MRRNFIKGLAVAPALPLVLKGEAQAQIGYTGKAVFSVNDFTEWDDFLSAGVTSLQIGKLGWGLVAASTGTVASVAGHPGIYGLSVAASAAGALYTAGPNGAVGAVASDIKSVLFIANYPTGANVPDKILGITSTSVGAAPADDAVYFECLAADTNWWAVTRDGATTNQTRTDTGVAFSAGTWVRFRIEHTGSQEWKFYMDDTLKATHVSTQNAPAEATGMFYLFQMTTKGTALVANLDFFATRLTPNR